MGVLILSEKGIKTKENTMIGYIRRNMAEIVNVVEAVLRLAGSIASLTATEKDDSVIATIKEYFSKIKSFLLNLGE